MRKFTTTLGGVGAAGVALAIAVMQWPAGAASVPNDGATQASAQAAANRPDNHPGPLTKQWIERRKAALALVAAGKAAVDGNGNVTVDAATHNVVEVGFQKTDKIFTILAEFGTQSVGRYGSV